MEGGEEEEGEEKDVFGYVGVWGGVEVCGEVRSEMVVVGRIFRATLITCPALVIDIAEILNVHQP